jgi:hypothetical protein
LALESPDVHCAVKAAGLAALIGGQVQRVAAGAEGRAAGQERYRLRRAAVVTQGSEKGRIGEDVTRPRIGVEATVVD